MTQSWPKAIHFPFQFSPDGRVMECTSYSDVVRGQIIDALMTNNGERPFRPRYGCDLQAMLFDPSQELERVDAQSMIKTRLESQVTRATIVDVKLRADNEIVWVDVHYRSSPYTPTTTLTVPASVFIERQLTQGITEIT